MTSTAVESAILDDATFEVLNAIYLHKMATAAHVAEEIIVMFAGQMVEWGSTNAVIGDPRHLYTQLLLSAVPDPDRPFVPGDSARFLGHAEEVRRLSRPASPVVEQVGPDHFVRALGMPS